jgi:hypothetical protein
MPEPVSDQVLTALKPAAVGNVIAKDVEVSLVAKDVGMKVNIYTYAAPITGAVDEFLPQQKGG